MSQTLEVMRMGEQIAELEDKLANADYQLEGRENEIKDLVCEVGAKNEVIDYAKSIIKSLLDNSDEYAEQRAREFLKE